MILPDIAISMKNTSKIGMVILNGKTMLLLIFVSTAKFNRKGRIWAKKR